MPKELHPIILQNETTRKEILLKIKLLKIRQNNSTIHNFKGLKFDEKS